MKNILTNFLSVLRYFKSASIINILGLTTALTVFFIVLMQVHYDFTYDKGYYRADDLYQFSFGDKSESRWVGRRGSNLALPSRVFDAIPEIDQYCGTLGGWAQYIQPETPEGFGSPVRIATYEVTQGFVEMFVPEIITGDTTGIFAAHDKALITEKTAKLLFGDEDPVGRRIKHYYQGSEHTIAAVFKDFPDNSYINNGLYFAMLEYPNSEGGFQCYMRVSDDDIGAVREKLATREVMEYVLGQENVEYFMKHGGIDMLEIRLTPLNDVYLKGDDGDGMRIVTTLSLLAIGVLTVMIAFINFLNLSFGIAPSRVRSLNIRKVLGISRSRLRAVIATESVLFTLIAIGLALLCLHFIRSSSLARQMLTTEISITQYGNVLAIASIVILVMAFGIGLYCARYATSFNESEALKGSFVLARKSGKLRNTLIVLQFTTAITLICLAGFIAIQHRYMRNFDSGLPKENVVYFGIGGLGDNTEAFAEEIMRNPAISDYSLVRDLPGFIGMAWGREISGKMTNMTVWSVDERFFDFFDIQILYGQKPSSADTLESKLVVNHKFLETFRFDETIVGTIFDAFNAPGVIVGVAEDVVFESLRTPIQPMAYGVLASYNYYSYFLLKYSPGNSGEAHAHIRETWERFTDDTLYIADLDYATEALYVREKNMAKLIAIFAAVVVLIAVMGVYGLILFNTRYKKKEIGIRKVNGSSSAEIISMLNRQMLVLLGISFVISVPASWYLINAWLSNFAFRAPVPWWLFLVAGTVVLMISLVAVSWQSWKAANANPVESIRNE